MTKTHAIEMESTLLFLFAAFAGVAFAFYFHQTPKIRTVFNLPVVAPFVSPTPTATPTPTVSTFSQVSSDGKKEVIMTVSDNGQVGKHYVFSVANGDGSDSQTLYTTTLPANESMSIPFNVFSPNDTYLFLEQDNSQGSEALAFQANGNPFSQSESYYNVTDIFNSRQTGNTYQTTTGWASDTLLIIDSKTPSGTTQSYWFEVTSKAIIPLATQF